MAAPFIDLQAERHFESKYFDGDATREKLELNNLIGGSHIQIIHQCREETLIVKGNNCTKN